MGLEERAGAKEEEHTHKEAERVGQRAAERRQRECQLAGLRD